MIKLSNELLVVEDGDHTQPLLAVQQSFCVLYCLLGPTLSIKRIIIIIIPAPYAVSAPAKIAPQLNIIPP